MPIHEQAPIHSTRNLFTSFIYGISGLSHNTGNSAGKKPLGPIVWLENLREHPYKKHGKSHGKSHGKKPFIRPVTSPNIFWKSGVDVLSEFQPSHFLVPRNWWNQWISTGFALEVPRGTARWVHRPPIQPLQLRGLCLGSWRHLARPRRGWGSEWVTTMEKDVQKWYWLTRLDLTKLL